MKIKKKIFMTTCLCLMLILSVSFIVNANSKSIWFVLGSLFKEDVQTAKDKEGEEIIVKSEHFKITKEELENRKEVYELSGSNKSADEALGDLIERKALIYKAQESGFSVSEADYLSYVEAFKKSAAGAENKEELYEYYEGFGGEENYWNTMEPVVKESLLIAKYMDAKMSEYAKELNLKEEEAEFITKWNVEQQNVIEDIVSEENIEYQDKSLNQ